MPKLAGVGVFESGSPVGEEPTEVAGETVTESILVVGEVSNFRAGEALVNGNFETFAGLGTTLTVLGRNEDHAVGTLLTVKYGSGESLQYADLGDVVGVEVEEAAGCRSSTSGEAPVVVGTRVERYPVHYEQRLVGAVDRAVTTDDDVSTRTGDTGSLGNVNTGGLTPEDTTHVGFDAVFYLTGADGRYGITEGLLLLTDTEGRYDYLVQLAGRLLQGNGDFAGRTFDGVIQGSEAGVAHYDEFRTGGYRQGQNYRQCTVTVPEVVPFTRRDAPIRGSPVTSTTVTG